VFGERKGSNGSDETRADELGRAREKHAAKGGIRRDALTQLVESGMSIAAISRQVGLSKTAVRYWLGRYGLKTRCSRHGNRETVAAAKAAGLVEVTMACRHHGVTQFVLEGRGSYRCKRCRSDRVSRRRRDMKEILMTEAGGRCVICGYDRHPCALVFHHLDPLTKRMPVSAGGISYALQTLRAEAQKCVLLCANCHAEVENGVVALALQ
jgi:hypothetical protein